MIRFFIKILSLFFFGGLISCQEKGEDGKPNVILILTDDQGYGDLGIHGNLVIETPVLDQFASESAHFDRFYVSPLLC